jgi:regulatory protein
MLSLYDQALKYLNIKMHSRQDLFAKLKRKGFEDAEINGVLNQLEAQGFVNDTLYAETFLRNLIEYRTFGYFGIRAKLMLKRLDKNLIDRLLRTAVSEEVEERIARRFAQKASNASRSKESLAQAMRQRGFRTTAILGIVNNMDEIDPEVYD